MARTKPWEASDALWERVCPLIRQRPPHPKGGRPGADDRQMVAAVVYLARTGIPWNAMPRVSKATPGSEPKSVPLVVAGGGSGKSTAPQLLPPSLEK